ncbi:ATP-binding protein [Pseudoduganella sp. SL102]|uniref:ATP-binding protein n=1 Tax=Pseudoduganella sp. SL102 TaxID=2995154 RepID=UPI00248C5ECE|nr:ATP-binding protein [Pseudoduganella sp. SL102]WBS04455.1 ATP-binding protein [Pseudoduganella sp. SL102]
MNTETQPALREEPSEARHVVRFYRDEVVLLAEAAEFLDRGLRGGGTAIVIATAEHRGALRQQLMGLGSLKGQRGWFPGELVMLDAADALAGFMVEDWPDEQRFDQVIGKLVRQVAAAGKPVHAFGEMVALLCEQGLYDAAVRLEQLWNALRRECRFALFCAYPWQLFPTDQQAADFHRICCEHDHVYPHGGDGAAAEQDVSVRLALLEHRNHVLEGEVARAREAERTLRQRERELADFIENAAEGLHRVGPDGIILWANKAELALLGYRWEEYVGHHIARFHADRAVIEDILQRLQAGGTLHDQPARLRCKDGSIRHVVISTNACFDDGRLRYTRCFTRDATERHLLEQAHREREALVAELSRSNQAKDEFLAMLAHELRNPLAPISAAAQLLAVAGGDPERVRQASAVIGRQVGHMKGLIDDLLDVARVTRGLVTLARHPLDLRDAVADAVEQAAPQIQARRHRLVLDMGSMPAMISGDRKRIIQAVANLVANAAKFTPDGGDIALRLSVTAEHVTLAVADSGIGMEPELATRIFDLFVQGRRGPDRTQGGLGIGLALARSLLQSHGGSLAVRSDGTGKGSTFTVCLPRVDGGAAGEPPPAMPGLEPPGHAQPGRALHIVVVDDNRDAADSLAGLLAARGHAASAVYSSAAALEAAAVACPQVFLLDIGLPDIDGIALAGRLRAMPEAGAAVLVAVTGYGQERDRESTRAAGFHHHLVKPVDTGELFDLLARL